MSESDKCPGASKQAKLYCAGNGIDSLCSLCPKRAAERARNLGIASGDAQVMRELRVENRRLIAALSAIHDRLHAGEVDRAHELCECALGGSAVSQPNLSVDDAARSMTLAADFNALIDRHRARAVCINLVPSATVRNAVSFQISGEVQACKIVEAQLRGRASTYMGDHSKP